MGNVFKILTAGLLVGLVHSPANTALVSFTGEGNFSNVTNCNGGSPGCSLKIVADFNAVIAAPGPGTSTWAMMILGFAGVAAPLPRRNRRNKQHASHRG